MKKAVCIIAAFPEINREGNDRGDGVSQEYFTCNERYWHSSAANQCISATRALLQNREEFLVKILTSASSDSSLVRKLKSLKPDIVLSGVAVEKTSEVAKQIDGSFGVFLVTDTIYDRGTSVEEEVAIGRAVGDACLKCGIKHVIYSTQMHVYASIGLRSDPCDSKAHIADYFTNIGLPRTLLVIPPLYEDFSHGVFKPLKTDRDNLYKIVAPTGYIPIDLISFKDLGSCICSIFKDCKQWVGKTITLSGDKMTLKEYAQILTHHLFPCNIEDAPVTPEEFIARHSWDGVEDMANYFDYLTRGVQRNNQITTMSLDKDVMSFYDWSKANKEILKRLIAE
ncbi:nmrA-like family domain-containing protein 1 [Clavelina lepadiformis]|uniref:nmrA-like family domain-containing protein 1 n=1 Tax=Clavelina lepadiformis TaxID=159417 RepID=UPI004042D0F0